MSAAGLLPAELLDTNAGGYAQVIDLGVERSRRRPGEVAASREVAGGNGQPRPDQWSPASTALAHSGVVSWVVPPRGESAAAETNVLRPGSDWLSDVRPGLLGRILSYVVVLVLVAALGGALGTALRAEPYAGPTTGHAVAQGESLWSLAASVESERPIREIMEDIRQLNALESDVLLVGAPIVLPVE